MKILIPPLSVILVSAHLADDFGDCANPDFYYNFVVKSCTTRNYIPELVARAKKSVFLAMEDGTVIKVNNETYELKAYGHGSSSKVLTYLRSRELNSL